MKERLNKIKVFFLKVGKSIYASLKKAFNYLWPRIKKITIKVGTTLSKVCKYLFIKIKQLSITIAKALSKVARYMWPKIKYCLKKLAHYFVLGINYIYTFIKKLCLWIKQRFSKKTQ